MDITNLRLMNAAGSCKKIADVEKLARSPVTEITVGSITVEPRDINEGDVFYVGDNGTSLNTLGLPNGGLPYYEKHLSGMVQIAHDAGKKIRASLAGFSPSEYVELTQLAIASGVDVIEPNTGCPNVWVRGGGGQKPIAAYSPELMTEILSRVATECNSKTELAVKVSPYEPGLLRRIAEIVASTKGVHSVVSANTFPNSIINDKNGKSVITFGDGYAGLAGTALKPIVLGQVMQFKNLLPKHVTVIAAGGISNGLDVRDYLNAGADGVQVGTAFAQQEDPKVFVQILEELRDLT